MNLDATAYVFFTYCRMLRLNMLYAVIITMQMEEIDRI
jgi:hypothetical protein